MINNCGEIKEAGKIVEIIGDFVPLKKKGVNYIACCPFHNERTASFIVNPGRNTFKCFGCGKSGDAIQFLIEHEAMSYPEALQYIAREYNITIEEEAKTSQQSDAADHRESILAALMWAQNYFAANLSRDKSCNKYLENRELISAHKEFGLGLSLTHNDLLKSASEAGFKSEILLATGLIRKNKTDSHYYDVFSNRLMFPFFDRTGRIIGFTGRLLVEDKGKPKYLNSPETEVFKKSKFLYGLFQSKREIMLKDECILVEGQTDLISLHLAGIKNVVAGSGTALSEDQVKTISTLTKQLTLIYDYDPAGIRASIKNIIIPLQFGLNVYIVVLPKDEDPDSLVRKIGGEEMKTFIEQNRKDIVSFRVDTVKEEVEADPLQKARLVKELTTQFSLIPDEQTRDILMGEIAKRLDINIDDLNKQVSKQLPKPEIKHEKGFLGIDAAKEAIKEKGFVIIVNDLDLVIESHAQGEENVISLPEGILEREDLDKLRGLTASAEIRGIESVVDDNDAEFPLTTIGRLLAEAGMRIQIVTLGKDEEECSTDFLDYYVSNLARRKAMYPEIKRSKQYVEMIAEFLSKLENTTIHINTNSIAKQLGLTAAAFSKVLKPYIDKCKSLARQHQEHIVINNDQYIFDIAHLPDYVDQEFYHRFGFFAAQNKEGHKIFYVFRTIENTLAKVGNFFLEPLFQVFDHDPAKNKRIVRLFHAELNKEEYVEFKSADMVELAQFKKFLWNNGGYLFTNGKPYHHEKILESIALKFPKCWELSVFGWQPEGFFAFSNGIIANGQFTQVDELGLVRYKTEMYYSPAFSKIYKDQRVDNDRYEYDRFLAYKEEQRTSWIEWTTLMHQVYQYNNNGMWAILFAILSANRSIIFPIDRLFTSLFFIGPTESGKSKIAESIRAPWMHGAPLFNLNSGTDAAFFTSLERFRDIPVIFEEYNDNQISDVKFQGLKAAVYDNEGKQKRKDATSKDIDVSKVNCSPLLLGQEGPERDDGALGNRVVIKHVPKKDNWTDEQVDQYKDLKDRERDGLSNIALDIIRKRSVVQKHFARFMRDCQKTVKQDIQEEGGSFQTRVVNTVNLFIAMTKLWEENVKDLPLPFTFAEFYTDAKRQIVNQSEELSTSNRLSAFFDTLSMLYALGQIIEGREFDIVTENRVTIQKSKNETVEVDWVGESKKILYLIVNDVIQVYQRVHNKENLKLNTLRMYLKDHPAYIGQIKSHRFVYEFEKLEADTANSDFTRRMIQKADRNTSCIALDYEIIFASGYDLERIKVFPHNTSSEIIENGQPLLETIAAQPVLKII